MTHIELSLSPLEPIAVDPLHSWSVPVSSAEESCLVIDASGVIVAASTAWIRLLSVERPSELAGHHVRDVLCLIDFTAAGNELGEAEREQIPPLLALTSKRPARGLLRVRGAQGAPSRTLDAVSTPLWQSGQVVGSLSFFAAV
ncbi:hypothetical protein Cme02nite_24090 [Catellatospora methionotrophica]|uniref:PAS domain-containing protein n=1 Tax=Catellatospora methionotrophica TaxID=121620 RepID=A0A8J3L882_9ACTN|nr:hypothetical protein [Catellatospora methionotrophica]GIG14077.1 hypothetical protein Cme02nite_24090 [Catellatospora methionotrophica]